MQVLKVRVTCLLERVGKVNLGGAALAPFKDSRCKGILTARAYPAIRISVGRWPSSGSEGTGLIGGGGWLGGVVVVGGRWVFERAVEHRVASGYLSELVFELRLTVEITVRSYFHFDGGNLAEGRLAEFNELLN